ncbi:hypothetical protein [Lysinibacillus sp. NPDC096259]|uniref:hypothetical protein n=1 Tax=Lysinibacillus sp. NPDC096259 TaxID=3390583 RepID=UPI003D0475A2
MTESVATGTDVLVAKAKRQLQKSPTSIGGKLSYFSLEVEASCGGCHVIGKGRIYAITAN